MIAFLKFVMKVRDEYMPSHLSKRKIVFFVYPLFHCFHTQATSRFCQDSTSKRQIYDIFSKKFWNIVLFHQGIFHEYFLEFSSQWLSCQDRRNVMLPIPLISEFRAKNVRGKISKPSPCASSSVLSEELRKIWDIKYLSSHLLSNHRRSYSSKRKFNFFNSSRSSWSWWLNFFSVISTNSY